MAPQELEIYILHDLYLVNMVSVLPRSKTAYLAISKNRPNSRLKKNVTKGSKIMKLTEVELQGTSRAEIIYFTLSMCNEYGFGTPNV